MTKKNDVINSVNQILATYDDKLTVRQVFYRLVSIQLIPSNNYEYKYYDRIITDARKIGVIDASRFIDLTRTTISDIDSYYATWQEKLEWKMSDLKDNPYLSTSANLLQPKITIIMLEKQALQELFRKAIGKMSVLIVNRGFNSYTQLYELAKLLVNDKREKNLYTFSDYDDSGEFIEKNFIKQCGDLGLYFDSFERVALTTELVDKYSLPINPTKKTTFASNGKRRGDVELDALDPNLLKDLVKECCKRNYDLSLNSKIRRYRRIQERRMKKKYAKQLREYAKSLLK